MDASLWPPFGLVVERDGMTLRLPRDDDLAGLLELASQGIHDPGDMPFLIPWTDTPSPERELESLRFYWGARASLRPEAWSLHFMVRVDGAVVGVQEVSARSFLSSREVCTGSWLGRAHQGRGIGTRMREMVLAFAFDHLGAELATSGAWFDNVSSQTVSRKLGYAEGPSDIIERRGAPTEHLNFRMTAGDWRSRGRAAVRVAGLEACREMLGLPDVSGR
jgi:RimJ/RimL family protein N-acetyltransferase